MRLGGLYRHYAVYMGKGKVIHYAAEKNGDFDGSVRIGNLDDFIKNSSVDEIFVVDFTEDGIPLYRQAIDSNAAFHCLSAKELRVFSCLRKMNNSFCLQSPEDTIKRAQGCLGENAYSLFTNNCEHFAIWCKTNVRESHQIEQIETVIAQEIWQVYRKLP